MKKILEHIFIAEIIFFSGSIYLKQFQSQLLILLFLTGLLLFLSSKSKFLKTNVHISITIVLWILFIQYFLITEKTNLAYLSFILNSVGVALGLSSITLNRFKTLILRQMSILMAISIIIQLGYNFGDLPTTTFTSDLNNGKTFHMFAKIFNVDWDGNGRMSSIYWEPGQCQILIMFTLCLFGKELLHPTKQELICFGILILAIIMTMSTMGYLVLALLIAGLFMFSKKKRGKYFVIKWGLGIIVAIASSFLLWNSSVVQEKLAQKDDASDRTSYAIRMADNIACWNVSLESPIFGMGFETKKVKSRLINSGSETASNGWLYTSACFGFPFILFIMYTMYKRIKEMYNNILPPFLIFMVLFIAQCNEYALFYPYLYIYIFQFKKNNNQNKSRTLELDLKP